MKMNNQFFCLSGIYDKDCNKWLIYEEKTKLWKPVPEFDFWPGDYNWHIHSFNAARRHLRKHDEIPKGTRFRLVSRFIGYDRILVKK